MRFISKSAPLLIASIALAVPLVAGAQEEAVATATAAATEAHTGIVPLISRWLHIFGAIFLLGGAFYLRAVLMPAANESLDGETHEKLRQSVMGRWRKIMPILFTLLILSGVYNFVMVTRFEHDGQPQYHMLFGIKFLLAMAVFALASMLAGTKSVSQKLQKNSKLWLGITIAMGVIIVMLAGYMKMM